MKENIFKKVIWLFIFMFWFGCPAMGQDFVEAVKTPINESINIRQETQKAEDQWAAEKARLEAQYETLQKEHDQLVSARDELNSKVVSHRATVAGLENEIEEASRISEELLPFLEEIYYQLLELIQENLPLLSVERQTRMRNLREMLDDAQITESEKFRKIMEALFVEAEYGNTIEVYQERINLGGKEILVDIFRLGRISLFFQTLDKITTGTFDPAQNAWKVLPKKYNREIRAAIEMGLKRRSVDLLNLPLGRIVVQ